MDSKLILVDVDDTLNIWVKGSECPPGFQQFKITPYTVVSLNPEMGEWLIELSIDTGAQLCWGSYWEDNANEYISPRLGLPQLPVMPIKSWKMSSSVDMDKAYSAAEFTKGRQFVFFDDVPGIGRVLKYHFGITNGLHIQVDPDTGITKDNIEQARKFLKP